MKQNKNKKNKEKEKERIYKNGTGKEKKKKKTERTNSYMNEGKRPSVPSRTKESGLASEPIKGSLTGRAHVE